MRSRFTCCPGRPTSPARRQRIALFDPKGETGIAARRRSASPTGPSTRTRILSGYDMLIIGKSALTVDGPAPAIERVRDGLKVVVFEQTSQVLEKRLGFRVVEYGLRQVFPRVPDHPVLAGIAAEHLRDWRGEATILPPRLDYELRPRYGPTVKWCDIPVHARLAVRQSRQRGLGVDREAGSRRLPADRRRRLQPAVQPAAGVSRRAGAWCCSVSST